MTVEPAGTLVLNLGTIAGDDTINIAEKAAGFEIAGDTGSEAGVSVSLTVGGTALAAVTSAADGRWSVSVPAAASYITGTSVAVTINAAKTNYTAATEVTRTLGVDLVAPAAPSYTAPGSLAVGVAMTAINPTVDPDIASYGATGLPSGLAIAAATGEISGTPEAASSNTVTATVTVSDAVGNEETVDIEFPAVAKGDQTLSGFEYSAAAVTLGTTVPTLTPPTGAETTLGYTASPPAVCAVNATTGVLTLVGAGACVVTATAAADTNWNEGNATFTITVRAAGTLVLNLGTIAGDDTINIAEKAAGFEIAGDTGSEAGVTVSVTVGGTALAAATSAADGRWSVSVPAAASYITGTSVAVTVNATKTNYTASTEVTHTLGVDLVAPAAPSYTAPGSLTVGVAMTAINPTVDPDIASYGATGLPSGLAIAAATGEISGTPEAANANTADVTVTV